MKPYDILSQYYDEVISQKPEEIKKILDLIKTNRPNSISILDVACGTGSVSKIINEAGYNVVGIDISEKMINVARKKLPKNSFIKMDMRKLDLNKKFDVVISVFDSVNHLLSFNDWKKFFCGSYNHLNEKGLLIFDINTLYKLQELSKKEPFIKFLENKEIHMKVYNRNNNIFVWDNEIFIKKKNNLIRNKRETIKETSFSVNKIKDCLLKKFNKIKIIDSNNLGRINKKSKRIFFICFK